MREVVVGMLRGCGCRDGAVAAEREGMARAVLGQRRSCAGVCPGFADGKERRSAGGCLWGAAVSAWCARAEGEVNREVETEGNAEAEAEEGGAGQDEADMAAAGKAAAAAASAVDERAVSWAKSPRRDMAAEQARGTGRERAAGYAPGWLQQRQWQWQQQGWRRRWASVGEYARMPAPRSA